MSHRDRINYYIVQGLKIRLSFAINALCHRSTPENSLSIKTPTVVPIAKTNNQLKTHHLTVHQHVPLTQFVRVGPKEVILSTIVHRTVVLPVVAREVNLPITGRGEP